jgi:hypothetical protein
VEGQSADPQDARARHWLILGLTAWVVAAPINQSGYSRPVPKQGGGGYSSDQRTRELEILADKYRPGY